MQLFSYINSVLPIQHEECLMIGNHHEDDSKRGYALVFPHSITVITNDLTTTPLEIPLKDNESFVSATTSRINDENGFFVASLIKNTSGNVFAVMYDTKADVVCCKIRCWFTMTDVRGVFLNESTLFILYIKDGRFQLMICAFNKLNFDDDIVDNNEIFSRVFNDDPYHWFFGFEKVADNVEIITSVKDYVLVNVRNVNAISNFGNVINLNEGKMFLNGDKQRELTYIWTSSTDSVNDDPNRHNGDYHITALGVDGSKIDLDECGSWSFIEQGLKICIYNKNGACYAKIGDQDNFNSHNMVCASDVLVTITSNAYAVTPNGLIDLISGDRVRDMTWQPINVRSTSHVGNVTYVLSYDNAILSITESVNNVPEVIYTHLAYTNCFANMVAVHVFGNDLLLTSTEEGIPLTIVCRGDEVIDKIILPPLDYNDGFPRYVGDENVSMVSIGNEPCVAMYDDVKRFTKIVHIVDGVALSLLNVPGRVVDAGDYGDGACYLTLDDGWFHVIINGTSVIKLEGIPVYVNGQRLVLRDDIISEVTGDQFVESAWYNLSCDASQVRWICWRDDTYVLVYAVNGVVYRRTSTTLNFVT